LSEAVEISQALGRFVEDGDGVVRKNVTVATGDSQAVAEIIRSILGIGRVELDAKLDAREERALVPACETLAELGQSDEQNRQEGAAVPLVVAEDMKVIEHVLMEQVGFVEEKDRMALLARELLDVLRDLVEDGRRGGLRVDAYGDA
jgi:hypothetical protein